MGRVGVEPTARWLQVPPKTYLRTPSRTNQPQKEKIRDGSTDQKSSCYGVWHQLGTNFDSRTGQR